MSVDIAQIRNEFMPGLREFTQTYKYIPTAWETVFGYDAYGEAVMETIPIETSLPTIPIETSLPTIPIGPTTALAIGAAAVVIKNPKVSRRNLFAFWRK